LQERRQAGDRERRARFLEESSGLAVDFRGGRRSAVAPTLAHRPASISTAAMAGASSDDRDTRSGEADDRVRNAGPSAPPTGESRRDVPSPARRKDASHGEPARSARARETSVAEEGRSARPNEPIVGGVARSAPSRSPSINDAAQSAHLRNPSLSEAAQSARLRNPSLSEAARLRRRLVTHRPPRYARAASGALWQAYSARIPYSPQGASVQDELCLVRRPLQGEGVTPI
jgi:hypothetical protein